MFLVTKKFNNQAYELVDNYISTPSNTRTLLFMVEINDKKVLLMQRMLFREFDAKIYP